MESLYSCGRETLSRLVISRSGGGNPRKGQVPFEKFSNSRRELIYLSCFRRHSRRDEEKNEMNGLFIYGFVLFANALGGIYIIYITMDIYNVNNACLC